MKDSGVEWIGEIPETWTVTKVKQLFEIGRGRVISKEELDDNNPFPVYSSQTKENGVLGYIATFDFDYPQLTWTTDGANAGTVFLRRGQYNCTNVCGTLKLKDTTNSLEFLQYVLQIGAPFYKRRDINGYKIMNNEMSIISFPLPGKKEQDNIVSILEPKLLKIDSVILDTQHSIEELKKYKQSLITEIVTKGLNKNVEMKDSGVEWIGDTPRHWKILRVKNILVESIEKSASGDEEPLSMSQKFGLIPSKDMDSIPNRPASYIGNKNVATGDLVFNKLKAHLGVFAVSSYDGIVSPDYAVYRTKGSVDVKYLEFLFKTPQAISEFIKYSKGVAAGLTRLYTDEFFSIKVSLPDKNEQIQIIEHLNKMDTNIERLIRDKQQVIQELEQYKKSLIYEYVTGKKEI